MLHSGLLIKVCTAQTCDSWFWSFLFEGWNKLNMSYLIMFPKFSMLWKPFVPTYKLWWVKLENHQWQLVFKQVASCHNTVCFKQVCHKCKLLHSNKMKTHEMYPASFNTVPPLNYIYNTNNNNSLSSSLSPPSPSS